jgi:ribosomal protein S27AE
MSLGGYIFREGLIMDNFITLTCPTCGGKLQITSDIERFVCGHCGNEHIIKRAGGIISLTPVVEELKKVGVSVDKTASELAINRLQREINELDSRSKAIIASHPMPSVNIIYPLIILFGIIGVLEQYFIHSNICLAGGIIMIVIGLIPYFTLSSKRKKWQDNFINRISPIDAEIAQKQEELDTHRKYIS